MYKQNQIKRTLSAPESIEIIRELLQDTENSTRTKLARRVCEEFEFTDTRGQIQISGCLKALRELETAGHFRLPAASKKPGSNAPRRLEHPVAPPINVPKEVGEVQDLQLTLVETKEELAIWNELMIEEQGPWWGGNYGTSLTPDMAGWAVLGLQLLHCN